MNYANSGLDMLGGGIRVGPHEQSAGYKPQTGWTPPTVLWERLRDVDNAADTLDRAIKALPTKRQAFLDSWSKWYKHLQDLVARYDSWSAKAAAATYSDDLASEIEGKRVELHSFEDAYRRERPEGQPENPPIPGMPVAPPTPPKPKTPDWMPKLEVPWWVWVLGAGVFVGLGALIYHRVKVTRADPRLREVTSRYGLPSRESVDRARHEVSSRALASVGRDPSAFGPNHPIQIKGDPEIYGEIDHIDTDGYANLRWTDGVTTWETRMAVPWNAIEDQRRGGPKLRPSEE